MTARYDFTMLQGATFNPVLLYSAPNFTVVPITGITKSGRAAVTAPAHGLVRDWMVFVVGVSGMTQINHTSAELLCPADAYYARYVNGNALALDLDSSGFDAYTSGGELMYHPPMDLTGYSAVMQIRATQPSTTIIHTLSSLDSPAGIVLGDALGTVELLIAAADTAEFNFVRAVYDLELTSPAGVVTRIMEGHVRLSKEITR
jgi:hypothetical protein